MRRFPASSDSFGLDRPSGADRAEAPAALQFSHFGRLGACGQPVRSYQSARSRLPGCGNALSARTPMRAMSSSGARVAREGNSRSLFPWLSKCNIWCLKMLTSHDFAPSRLPRVPDRRGQATATPIHTASATHSLPSQDGMGGWCGMAPTAQRANGAGLAEWDRLAQYSGTGSVWGEKSRHV